ncbi:hypothetical protein CNEO3_210041 [Clostridium neonatale]|nr:hypothetical protein CNEO3_210041 [Clostridium neonatale]
MDIVSMILEKNKEIQYMNMRSIALNISDFKFFERGCSKIVCPTLVVGANCFGHNLFH